MTSVCGVNSECICTLGKLTNLPDHGGNQTHRGLVGSQLTLAFLLFITQYI